MISKIDLYKERIYKMSAILKHYERDAEFFSDVTNDQEKQEMLDKFNEEFAGELAGLFQLTHELLKPKLLTTENY